jgi:tetratricopeptide (TPR) repeat protein
VADSLYGELLKVWIELYGAESSKAGFAYLTLGQSARALKELDRSEKNLLMALELIGKELGEENSYYGTTLWSLGALNKERKQYDAARERFLAALKNREKAFGPDHRQTAAALYALADIEYIEQDFELAKSYADRSLAIENSVFGESEHHYSREAPILVMRSNTHLRSKSSDLFRISCLLSVRCYWLLRTSSKTLGL